jgi:signal transduction histidine kinase
MLVRAGAARVVLDSSPEQAREILLGVEQTGREALEEMDHVLGVLRRDDDVDLRPGLSELPHLAQRLTEAGMDVAVRIEPSAQHLPRSLDVSAYRIVQEALTNALRHGRARTASVTVGCDGTSVRLDVRDDGQGPQPDYRPGRGLLGIAERAAVFAGAVEHGAGAGGGFRVRAELPLPVTERGNGSGGVRPTRAPA